MNPTDDLARRADEYVKRLLERNNDTNNSFESFTKSLRRRKNIMDALSESRLTSAAVRMAEEDAAAAAEAEANPENHELSEASAPMQRSPTARQKAKLSLELKIGEFINARVLKILEPEVTPMETPKKCMYPSLASMERRMSEHCSKKLEFIPDTSTDDSYGTPMPLKEMPRRHGYRPDLESTRKQLVTSCSQNDVGLTGISTLTLPNTPAPYSCVEPLEVREFLRLALGDEHSCDTTIAEAPKHCSTIDRTKSVYRSLSKSIKNAFRSKRQTECKETARLFERAAQAVLTDPQEIKRLLDLIEMHHTQIYQASKALELCESMPEFAASAERVELERLLLLATLCKQSARDQIRPPSQGIVRPSICCERAELTIDHLSLDLPADERRGEVEWLLLLAREGSRVWASQPVARTGQRIFLPDALSLPELTPDFKLCLGLYSLTLRPAALYSHEDKYHIEPEYRADVDDRETIDHGCTGCPLPSPQRLLSGERTPKTGPRSPRQFIAGFSGLRQSSFRLRASLTLGLEELGPARESWRMQGKDSDDCSLRMELRCRLQLRTYHAGFLTHGDEAGGLLDWNRRWCVLQGRSLLFWNYPREQEDQRPPIHMIDLLGCLSPSVEQVERSLCPRSRTLIIETARRRAPSDADSMVFRCRHSWTIVRNLLSCDTQQDLMEWQCKLNHVVSALHDWNLIDDKSPQVSDL